ncbi:hypothetical protein M501DRAFT_590831 [Patellaria atrata CBS 101060]|uniref:BTB domain-containing protein n=1 Tax=Patellaria atrata CBS 101060 TaxID=1346257 RepID=A0A9P4S1P2_9PEZI|nr:hypothetical protein M501DRAFT_590831 [Patellaria atrata CBS 101060]
MVQESDRFRNALNGNFNESETEKIDLSDEDLQPFGYFVDYLYRETWLLDTNTKHPSENLILTRLYLLGERLQASSFQAVALRKFGTTFRGSVVLDDQSICNLLEIACTELPQRVQENPLHAQIYCTRFTSSHLCRSSQRFVNC